MCKCVSEMHACQVIGSTARPNPDCKICHGTGTVGKGIVKAWNSPIKTGMNKKEFEDWKKEWLLRIPKCKKFCCVHESTSCAIDILCACGSIWETYSRQKYPIECTRVSCLDCMLRWECKESLPSSL